jgi:endoglucanase
MKLGAGPAIKIQDRSLVANHHLNRFIASEAEKLHIPYQYEVLPFGGTDAGVIQTTKAGVKATCLSIPTRYGHSPSEVVDTDDVNHCIQLLLHIAETPLDLE